MTIRKRLLCLMLAASMLMMGLSGCKDSSNDTNTVQIDLELLYLVDGDAEITSDHQRCTFSPGQIAVINCTCLHSVKAINQSCSYYCLIVGQN